jgi:hypothetical protein
VRLTQDLGGDAANDWIASRILIPWS